MSTIKIKSTELVRKFADIKTLVLETGSRVIVEEYRKPVLAIYPCDEDGEVIMPKKVEEISDMERLKKRLEKKNIKFTAVNFV